MTCSHLRVRLVAVVTGAAVLLVVPAATGSTGALAGAGASAASALRIDTDGDELDDTVDGCPTVASTSSTGCPSATRSVSLAVVGSTPRLRTRVTSPVGGCASRARIVLWRVRPRGDRKVFGGSVSLAGRLRIKVSPGASYYVTVPTSYSSGIAECGPAVSTKVSVQRP